MRVNHNLEHLFETSREINIINEQAKCFSLTPEYRYNATDDENEYVFVTKTQNTATPLSNRTVETLVKKYTKAFKTNKSMSPHKLRHTYATNFMAQEKDIHLLMSQLGHTSTTTAALYDNPELDKAQEAAAKMGKRRR